MFKEALDQCCECKDDGTAMLKQPFLHSFLDARGADVRKPMVGAVDFMVEETDEGGIRTTQITYPLEYECLGGSKSTLPAPISPLRGSLQADEQGK